MKQKPFGFKMMQLPSVGMSFKPPTTISKFGLGVSLEGDIPSIVLSPEEESKLMDRYERTKKDHHPVGHRIGDGDHRAPTLEEIHQFVSEREQIVRPLVKEDLKEHGGVFHGKHNVNRIYRRELGVDEHPIIEDTYDYDIWVGDSLKRAYKMQKKIDNHVGFDITYAEKQPAPHDAKARWAVKSRGVEDKPEVDYVTYPNPIEHPYKTEVDEEGIEYETLESSMAREKQLSRSCPMRQFKSMRNLQNYREFKKLRGEY